MSKGKQKEWTCVLEGEGGSVIDFCPIKDRSGKGCVLALTPLGLFSTADRAESWSKFLPGNAPPLMQAVAVAYDQSASVPSILVGCAVGLFRANKAEATWDTLFSGLSVEAIGLPNPISLGAPLLAATIEQGLLISNDFGSTWTDANTGLSDGPIVDICFSPLYASDKTIFVATDSDVYRSRNNGRAWRRLNLDLHEFAPSIRSLSVSVDDSLSVVVWVGLTDDGILTSQDLGSHWAKLDQFFGSDIRDISVIRTSDGRDLILVASEEGVFRSIDSGRSWERLHVGHPNLISATMVPGSPSDVLLVGMMDDGVARKTETCDDWSLANRGLQAVPRTHLSVVCRGDETASYVIVDDVKGHLLCSPDGGISWESIHMADPSNEHRCISVSQLSPEEFSVILMSDSGSYELDQLSRNWELLFHTDMNQQTVGIAPLGGDDGSDTPRFVAILDNGEVIKGGRYRHWESLGRHFGLDKILSAEITPSPVASSSMWAILYSTNNDSTTATPSLWTSDDGGTTWVPWIQSTAPDAMALGVTCNAVGHEEAFVGVRNVIYKLVDRRPLDDSLQRRLKKWNETLLEDENVSITGIGVSPGYCRDRTVFVASNAGVFVSRDGGNSFDLWSDRGPKGILGIQLSPHYPVDKLVYVLEVGGAVWMRSDVSVGSR